MNLAYAELYMCVAGVFRRYGGPDEKGPSRQFRLFDTTTEDVAYLYDLFVPFPKIDSKGVRVILE